MSSSLQGNVLKDSWDSKRAHQGPSKMQMLQSGSLTIGDKTVRFTYKAIGMRPMDGYALLFGFHGGGNSPQQVNNQQYENHKNLYDKYLTGGVIWFAMRSAQNDWDMWFKDYLQDFILQIIRAFTLNQIVNPNKVYLSGYSAGGDGIYHMAPRMADYLAGAAMMAGHPNEAILMNIRNIGFSIQVGGQDNAYNRKNQAIKYIRMVNQLRENYGGFQQRSKIHQNKPHWMNGEDAQVFSWLLSLQRNPYPDVIMYRQCSRRKKNHFYYLGIGENKLNKNEQQLIVLKQNNNFYIYGNRVITIYVNRYTVDINQPIRVYHNDNITCEKAFSSNIGVVMKTLTERMDPFYIFQDQIVSAPTIMIDIKQTLCNVFGISHQEKDADYQEKLDMEPSNTPKNFNKSTEAVYKRKGPFRHRVLNKKQQQQGWIQNQQYPPPQYPQSPIYLQPQVNIQQPLQINQPGLTKKQSLPQNDIVNKRWPNTYNPLISATQKYPPVQVTSNNIPQPLGRHQYQPWQLQPNQVQPQYQINSNVPSQFYQASNTNQQFIQDQALKVQSKSRLPMPRYTSVDANRLQFDKR